MAVRGILIIDCAKLFGRELCFLVAAVINIYGTNGAEALEGDKPLTAYEKVEVWMKRKRQIWERPNQKPKFFSHLWGGQSAVKKVLSSTKQQSDEQLADFQASNRKKREAKK